MSTEGAETSKSVNGNGIDNQGDKTTVQQNVKGATVRPGEARIKKEYLKVDYKPQLMEEFVSKDVKEKLDEAKSEKRKADEEDQGQGKPSKRVKVKGRNKKRPVNQINHKAKLCPSIFQEKICNFGDKCKFSHDVEEFVKNKPPDLGDVCLIFETYGKCPYGIACRFGVKHIDENNKNIVNEELFAKTSKEKKVSNTLPKELQVLLWKKRYNFDKANEIVKVIQDKVKQKLNTFSNKCAGRQVTKEQKGIVNAESQKEMSSSVSESVPKPEGGATESSIHSTEGGVTIKENDQIRIGGGVTDEEVIKLRPQEKKKIEFAGKSYLAPLTTVGNLPFRRVCKEFGVDITCSEMAMATNILNGQMSEWALMKRHVSEDLFGVQICGGWPDSLSRCAQLINEKVEMDFVDLNCGCPIDLVYKRGEGSALPGKLNKFEQIIRGMKSVLDVPLTVKMRTGIFQDKNIAHTVIPKLRDWGAAMVTLHGRSREQRYTRLADWEYINQCAEAADPMPLFGNGDILSYEDLDFHLKQTKVKGVMVARGALIKPWIFTEMKERRHWDISASERYDMLKRYTSYGLEHWGSDHQGVETTRRFLMEWLSFLYRYIPVGLLEQVPQKINERPPYYVGRNDLETLMASPSCLDWIKLSEMLLGPVPEGYNFLPKHKANAYK
ncbi:hypothetical protein FSP39_021934 [Pinctada imbricata]|uniref:tRNA-dihydrouridine(47) synthase [NAD(P)(+)] n=1 Tax=Pinctada imbricata TaxID=66713 RepID=A0AA88YPD8_PINIB|nr:hypothetical protein FSP39_021934 [Pinctada imbricata]